MIKRYLHFNSTMTVVFLDQTCCWYFDSVTVSVNVDRDRGISNYSVEKLLVSQKRYKIWAQQLHKMAYIDPCGAVLTNPLSLHTLSK